MEGFLDYAISLEVRGFSIQKDKISSLLGFNCTEFYDEKNRHKDFIKTEDDFWSHNLWVYTIETDGDAFENDIIHFLQKFNFEKLTTSGEAISDVRLHITINSSYAQIHLPLNTTVIQEISHLGVNVDINIVSLGCVVKKTKKFSLTRLFSKK